MESLALLVAILFLIAIFAGPLAILLSSNRIKGFTESTSSPLFVLLSIARRFLHLLLILFGTVVGVQFGLLTDIPLGPRLIGLLSIATCYIALRREYFPDFYLLSRTLQVIGINIRSPRNKSQASINNSQHAHLKRNGRSSGKDDHGPAGQH